MAVSAGAPTLAFIGVQLAVHLAVCLAVGRGLLNLPTWVGALSRGTLYLLNNRP